MKYLIPGVVALLMVSVGMSLSLRELIATLRRLTVLAWIRMLLATFILPAAIALVLARWFHLTRPELVGIFLVGVAPGAPLLTRNLAKKGFDMHLAATYQVWAALMIPVMIPVIVAAAAKLYNRDIWISPLELVAQVAEKQFLPLAVGMLIARAAPARSQKWQPALNMLGNIILTLVLGLALFKLGPALKAITPLLPVLCLLLALGCIAAVRLIRLRDPLLAETFAISNANRHVGLAVLLSGEYFHSQQAVPPIACYALLSPLVMIVYARLYRRGKPPAKGVAGEVKKSLASS
jgi:bile acid:Na+ symporter, BASS family